MMKLETEHAIITCPSCGLVFAVPSAWEADRRRDRKNFFCPNGHSLSFNGDRQGKRIKELEEQLARAQKRAELEAHQKESARRRLAAQKGVTTRIKNRIAAGKCPCCRAEFADLAAHMADRHPDFTAPEGS